MALVVKTLPANAGGVRDTGLIPGSGRSTGGGNGNPLEYSCLENPWRLQSIGSQRVGHDWVTLRGGLGAEMDFLLGELTALEASPQVGFWGPLPGAHVFQGHNPLVMIFCVSSCLGPALCPVLMVCSCFLRGALLLGHLLPQCLRTTRIHLQIC